jgi:hypothetical protein
MDPLIYILLVILIYLQFLYIKVYFFISNKDNKTVAIGLTLVEK